MRRRHQRRPTPSTRPWSGTASPPTPSTASARTPPTAAPPADDAPRPWCPSPRPTARTGAVERPPDRHLQRAGDRWPPAPFTLPCSRPARCPRPSSRAPAARRPTPLDPAADLAVGERVHAHRVGVAGDATSTPTTRRTPWRPTRTSTFTRRRHLHGIDTTPIPAIQGSGDHRRAHRHPHDPGRRRRRLRGRVARRLRGFYLQDPPVTATRPPPTRSSSSTAATTNVVDLGDVVTVTGSRRRVPGPDPDLGDRRQHRRVRHRARSPPTDVALPMASATAFERYEGMLVRMPQTLTVTEHFQLGRFGEVARLVRRAPPAADQRRRARRPGRGAAGGQQPQPDPHRRRDQRAEPRPDRLRPGRRPAERRPTRCAAVTPSPASPAS